MPKVVHCKKEPYDVYIGRPSKWGNPYIIGVDGTREEVISRHRYDIEHAHQSVREMIVRELRGKTLGCWCAPKACHGDILLELANK